MTIATVSYKAAISVGKARVAVQTKYRKFYNRFYYLAPNEQEKYEPQLQTIKEESNLAIPAVTKKARSADAYQSDYQFVLPDRKAVSDFKYKKSLHQEIKAAEAPPSKKRYTYNNVSIKSFIFCL